MTDQQLKDAAAAMPPTFEEFYEYARWKPPFDLSTNPMGFREGSPPHKSCQSALMPILTYFASQCKTVAEFGCREGYSTAALIKGLQQYSDKSLVYPNSLVSYDIVWQPVVDRLMDYKLPCNWFFVQRDTTQGYPIPPVDYLHVDDLHTYDQVKTELALHGDSARRFLSFHDTVSQGVVSLDRDGQEGIVRAIDEYTASHGFRLVLEVFHNHGLRVYERN